MNFDYEHAQLQRWINESFVIVRGPLLSGKSTGVRTFFERAGIPCVIFDVKTLLPYEHPMRRLVQDFRKTLDEGVPKGSVKYVHNMSLDDEFDDDLASMLFALSKGTYVVFDHADFFSRMSDPYKEYPLEVFQEFIDTGYHHFVFVPASMTQMIKYLGPRNVHSPLFMRYEMYVDFVPASPVEVRSYLGCGMESDDDLWKWIKTYNMLGGLKGAVALYKNVKDFNKFVKSYVDTYLTMYYPGKDVRRLKKVFAAIAEYTRVFDRGVVRGKELEFFENKLGIQKDDVQRLISIDLVVEVNGRIAARKPFHVYR